MEIRELLQKLVDHQGSDLHLKTASRPWARVHGDLVPMDFPTIERAQMDMLIRSMVSEAQLERFIKNNELDFSVGYPGIGRFRVNLFRQRGEAGAALRHISEEIPKFDNLGLPSAVQSLAEQHRGLVLVTGTTGSGKSTSLAAMLGHINAIRKGHIMTVEDPIEFLHKDNQCLINQREILQDTESFAEAMKHVLRQDPDVILLGEIRDPVTAETALNAAETGHLVFSTLHTIDAAATVSRMVDLFPSEHRNQARIALASALKGVISQRLMPKKGGGRVPCVEILVVTSLAQECIADPAETHRLKEVMEKGAYYGMQTFDQALLKLIQNDQIDLEEAFAVSTTPHDLKIKLSELGIMIPETIDVESAVKAEEQSENSTSGVGLGRY